MTAPLAPKIYHIVHVDKLPAIVASGGLLSHARLGPTGDATGTPIGIETIKARRLTKRIDEMAGTCVGECVPFYFCSRSYMAI